MHQEKSARRYPRIKIFERRAQRLVEIAIEMHEAVPGFGGQLRGGIGKIPLDEMNVPLADERAHGFE
jgi:hypothetical protein